MIATAPTCHCGADPIGHVHTREPRRARGENPAPDQGEDDTTENQD